MRALRIAGGSPALRNRWRREALAGVLDNAARPSYRELCWRTLRALGTRFELEAGR
jgi:hypothetical protein